MSQEIILVVKPNALAHADEIYGEYADLGWHRVQTLVVHPDSQQWEYHYAEHKERPWYPNLIATMKAGTSYVWRMRQQAFEDISRDEALSEEVMTSALDNEDYVMHVTSRDGAEEIIKARVLMFQLRERLRDPTITNTALNSLHCSDSVQNAEAEVLLWFGGD